MGNFIEKMENLTISARSSDGTVVARYIASEGYSVSFEGRIVDSHDDRSLEASVTSALTGIRDGFAIFLEKSAQELDGKDSADRNSSNDSGWDNYLEQIDGISVETRSPEGYVKVLIRGDGVLQVRMKPGTVRQVGRGLDQRRLAANINTALNDAFSQYFSVQHQVYLKLQADD